MNRREKKFLGAVLVAVVAFVGLGLLHAAAAASSRVAADSSYMYNGKSETKVLVKVSAPDADGNVTIFIKDKEAGSPAQITRAESPYLGSPTDGSVMDAWSTVWIEACLMTGADASFCNVW